MPYVVKGSSARWVDPAEDYVLQAGESFADEPPTVAPDFEALKKVEKAVWMTMREPYFARLASIDSRLSLAGDVAGAASAVAVANSLMGLFTDSTVMAAIDIATYKYALKERYKQAIALATPSAAAEFGKYDK